MTDAVRLGIVGLGAQGSMYGRLIADGRVPGMVIGALCDSDPEALARGQEQHPGIPAHAAIPSHPPPAAPPHAMRRLFPRPPVRRA